MSVAAGLPCTVSELNRHVGMLMRRDLALSDVTVRGEISNYRPHYSGHMYLTLKDESSQIRCVMFRSAASRLRFAPGNGMSVVARGAVGVFERDGQYQLYCESMEADGVGNLYAAFERMKRRLEEEGLFSPERKRRLPLIPQSVCVITSPTGSVVHDIINVATRRRPEAVIKIMPVKVQGEGSAAQVARAVRAVGELGLAEVVIVARGGGSLEELWAFNEEAVARAVSESPVPVVSAVGHETDFTICDFAADVRAPTPSAAAELVFPDSEALRSRVASCDRALRSGLAKRIERARVRLSRGAGRPALAKPLQRVDMARVRVASAEDRLSSAMRLLESKGRSRVAVLSAKLDALSPLASLSRGYSVVYDAATGRAVKSACQVRVGQTLGVRLSEGRLAVEVIERIAREGAAPGLGGRR